MSEVDPGQTAGGGKGISQQYEYMGAREVAYQTLLANPPPLPAKYSPPMEDSDWDEAVEMYLKRLGETVTEAWDQVHEQRLGHISEADWVGLWSSHEPLFIPQWQVMEAQLAEQVVMGMLDPHEAETRLAIARAEPTQQNPVPNPWLAALMTLSSRQAAIDMQRYIRIRSRTER